MTSVATGSAVLNADELQLLRGKSVQNRLAVMKEIEVSGSGHYGPSFSAMEIFVSLYYGYLRLRPDDPGWLDRDRFVLGKGHACSGLYPILADLGYFDPKELDSFCRLGSILGDHPDMKKVPGIDFSSGSLGHGLSVSVGMALGAVMRGNNSRTVTLLGDGEQSEGQMWEAVALAGARRLSGMLAIVDVNGVQVDGTTDEVLAMEPMDQKWESFGWRVEHVDGHDHEALRAAYDRYDQLRASVGAAPTVLLAKTVSGRGIEFIEGAPEWHVGYLGKLDRERGEAMIGSMFSTGRGASR